MRVYDIETVRNPDDALAESPLNCVSLSRKFVPKAIGYSGGHLENISEMRYLCIVST